MSLIQAAKDFIGWHGEEDAEHDYIDDEVDEYHGSSNYGSERRHERDEDVIPLRKQHNEHAAMTIVRADPKNIEQAAPVADEIKRRKPVLLNLQAAPEAEAHRIRDFLGGVTYGLDGSMRRIAEWVYVCAPFDMPVERLMLDGSHAGEPRYVEDERRCLSEI